MVMRATVGVCTLSGIVTLLIAALTSRSASAISTP